MKLLIIGNGFDVAHDLKTKYSDFLEFVNSFSEYYSERIAISRNRGGIYSENRNDLDCIDYLLFQDVELGELFHEKTSQNIWIDYFLQLRDKEKKTKWLDFEFEIENVIKSIDRSIGSDPSWRQIDKIDNDYFRQLIDETDGKLNNISKFTYDELLEKMHDDLLSITDALEIYLFIYVERYGWKANRIFSKLPAFEKVLSFNYTDTYLRLYDHIGSKTYNLTYDVFSGERGVSSFSGSMRMSCDLARKNMYAEYCFVHGQVRTGQGNVYSRSDNRLVLGISDENEQESIFINSEKKYHRFQKFLLRNLYGDNSYKKWINEIKAPCQLYIIGHSLAYSDRDVIIPFITNPFVETTVYYYDMDAKRELNENLIDILGKDMYKRLSSIISFRPVSELY